MSWKERRNARKSEKEEAPTVAPTEEKEKKVRKPFGETKVGQWGARVKEKFPDLAGNILDIATSANPLGAALDKVKEKLTGKLSSGTEEERSVARELLLEADQKIREWEKDMYGLSIEDRKSARDMYINTGHSKANEIANKVIRWNLLIVALLVVVEVIVVKYLGKTEIALLSGTIGYVINAMLHERLTVINFFFGSSLGSKNKSQQLSNMKDDAA